MQSPTIKSYADADEILTGRCKDRRKIANNTWLERVLENAIAVRLHQTDVVVYYSDGSILLDTGGWFTVTTKQRINEFSPFGVHSTRGEWSVMTRNPNHVHRPWPDVATEPYWLPEVVPFRDRMMWDGTRWHGVPEPSELDRERAERKKLNRDIKKFVDGITPERIIHAWENPGGDCLMCRVEPMFSNTDHLAMHIEEDYFHASLAYLAVKARGHGDPGFVMQMIYSDAKRGEVSKTFLKDSLTKFLRKQLTQGVAVAA